MHIDADALSFAHNQASLPTGDNLGWGTGE